MRTMKKPNGFLLYLIAVAVIFSFLNMIGVYEDKSDFMQDTDCYIYSYYLKTDKHKVEQYTYDYDSIDDKLHEIFQQKVPCEEYEKHIKFGYNWHVLLLFPISVLLTVYIDRDHKKNKWREKYKKNKINGK